MSSPTSLFLPTSGDALADLWILSVDSAPNRLPRLCPSTSSLASSSDASSSLLPFEPISSDASSSISGCPAIRLIASARSGFGIGDALVESERGVDAAAMEDKEERVESAVVRGEEVYVSVSMDDRELYAAVEKYTPTIGRGVEVC